MGLARVIIITGTPGVGKTTVAEALAHRIGAKYVNVGRLVAEEGLASSVDVERKTLVADMDRLSARIMEIISVSGGDLIIEGHYAYDVVPKDAKPYVFVLRCDPAELEARLRKRGYDERKVSENVAAEALDVCLIGAINRFGKNLVDEIDVTRMDVNAVVEEILSIINGEKTVKVGKVDWLGKLEMEGRLDGFLSKMVGVECSIEDEDR
jgi:adenylate kinase